MLSAWNAGTDERCARGRALGALSDLPGHPMMWVLILTEVVTFGLLLATFTVTGAVQPGRLRGGPGTARSRPRRREHARADHQRMAGRIGRRGPHDRTPEVGASAARGSGGPGLHLHRHQVVEYAAKVEAGIGLETDTFFTLYFLITGFHLLHVVLGIVIIAAVALHDSPENLKTGTAFWHMVDLVWVVMYPLVYLVG
jgi:nitric oxide reductase NorE protein